MGFEAVNFITCRRPCSQLAKDEKDNRSYENAVKALNGLVTNAAFVQRSITKQTQIQNTRLAETIKYLNRAGMELEELEQLKFVHVSGTKGKGSTCALVESILRYQGFRTGFFSSPHLVSVTERIRLQGLPISQLSFAKYFWIVYDRLKQGAENETDMPPYFQFLTIMSFYVFLNEQIDVAIMEVGIGGEYDCTNIIPNTSTVGITSLGLDHVQILGDTIEKIAWQKAGIIKPESYVFTVKQAGDSDDVIRERATEKKAKLFIAPHFNEYKWTRLPNLQFDIEVQKLNISLAIQLAFNWMHHYHSQQNSNAYQLKIELPEEVTVAIERCYWPGRCQYLQYRNNHFYIDGAHTLESIQVCSEWFRNSCDQSLRHKKVLVFNVTGNRDVEPMLKLLDSHVTYDAVFFVPNLARKKPLSDDNMEKDVANQNVLETCQKIRDQWLSMRLIEGGRKKEAVTQVFPSVFDMLLYLDKSLDGHSADVLVTGSLHLVGAFFLGLEEFDKVACSSDQNNKTIHHYDRTT